MKKILTRKILTWIICLFSAQLSLATVLQGTLIKGAAGDDVFLSINDRSYKINYEGQHIKDVLSRLDEGDFISAQGSVSKGHHTANHTAEITSIDFVGLQRVMGFWLSENFELFNIHSYSDLEMYLPHSPSQLMQPSTINRYKFRYSLLPSKDDLWLLFMVGDKEIIFGSLKFHNKKHNKKMEVTVYNEKTKETEKFYFFPLL